MLVLDTNHMSEVVRRSVTGQALIERLDQSMRPVATTIITFEEMLRGWLSRIRREHDPIDVIPLYSKLQEISELTSDWTVLPWDQAAAMELRQLNSRRLKIGTMDLKIAGIVLAHKATLLSRNLRDFHRVPNLNVENWLT